MTSDLNLARRTGPWFVVSMRGKWDRKELERSRKPSRLFQSLAAATAEACHLAKLHPKMHYGIFECVGYIGIEGFFDTDTEPQVSREENKQERRDMGIGFKSDRTRNREKRRAVARMAAKQFPSPDTAAVSEREQRPVAG